MDKRFSSALFPILGIALALPACAQTTWVKVATESPTTTVVLPVGTVYRLGSGTCWSANTTVSKALTLTNYWPTGIFPFADPCPNVTKELDVLQTSTAQSVPVTANGQTSTVTVPAVITKPTIVATYTCTVNLYSDGTYVSTSCTKAGK